MFVTLHKVDDFFQVNGYVKYFLCHLGIICNPIMIAYTEMILKDYFCDNQ